MIKLKINNIAIEVSEKSTIIDAANSLGIEIPTMCYAKEHKHITSCMICMVKDENSGKLLPACSTPASEGMNIHTDSKEVKESRKDALELLLSDHVGDCVAPCQNLCPAHMNIPEMTRLIAQNKMKEALINVKNDIALPAILGYICPAPCEKGCRRGSIDSPVSICLLKRIVAENDLSDKDPFIPKVDKQTNKRISIIGSGPTGLASAYYLLIQGHKCDIYDKNEMAGGELRNIPEEELPKNVLDKEIDIIKEMGAVFHQNTKVDDKLFSKIKKDSDAIVIATGKIDEKLKLKDLNYSKKGIIGDPKNYTSETEGIFAGGNALRESKLAVRSVGHGKEIAVSIKQYLNKEEVKGVANIFNSKFGKLQKSEFKEYLKEAEDHQRIEPKSKQDGLSTSDAIKEAKRCLHCDCRKPVSCKLRIYANEYNANQKQYQVEERKLVRKQIQKDLVIYEPEKCIKCGLCIKVTEKNKEDLGLCFIGRGFEVEVGVPFNESIGKGLEKTAKECCDICPTGALTEINKIN